jgi:hypothetical protein
MGLAIERDRSPQIGRAVPSKSLPATGDGRRLLLQHRLEDEALLLGWQDRVALALHRVLGPSALGLVDDDVVEGLAAELVVSRSRGRLRLVDDPVAGLAAGAVEARLAEGLLAAPQGGPIALGSVGRGRHLERIHRLVLPLAQGSRALRTLGRNLVGQGVARPQGVPGTRTRVTSPRYLSLGSARFIHAGRGAGSVIGLPASTVQRTF